MSDKAKELIARFRSGGELSNADEKAYSELSDMYAPMISSMAAKYSAMCADDKDGDYQDMYQEASIAFYRSVMTYDLSSESVSFGLYAKICVRNALVSALRRIKKRTKANRSQKEAKNGAEDPLSGVIAKEEREKLLRDSEGVLSNYERQVISLYLSGNSVRGIAASLGRSEKSVSNALFRCRTKLSRRGR